MKYTAEIKMWGGRDFEVEYEYDERVLMYKVVLVGPIKEVIPMEALINTYNKPNDGQTMYSFVRDLVEDYHRENGTRGYAEEADIQYERGRDGA